MRIRQSAPVAVLAALVPAGSLPAAVVVVPDDQPTIQAGIDAASDGDTVLVAPGVYLENLLIDRKSITLQGMGLAEATVIDGGGIDRVLTVIGARQGVNLSNLTIRGGGNVCTGGGIDASDTPMLIVACVISDNTALCPDDIEGDGAGGGISANADLTICSSTIADNLAKGNGIKFTREAHGGGIAAGTVTLQDCVVRDNRAEGDENAIWPPLSMSVSGGGIKAAAVFMVNCDVRNNYVQAPGCGAFAFGGGVSGSSVSAVGCKFLSNTATAGGCAGSKHAQGGGVNTGSGTLERSVFRDNLAKSSPGNYSPGTALWASSVEVKNCEFVGGSVDYGSLIRLAGANTITSSTMVEIDSNSIVVEVSNTGSLVLSNSIVVGSGLSGPVDVTYCLVSGGWEGRGNISGNPKFVLSPGFPGGGFLRLRSDSPCIDAGSNALAKSAGPIDLDGRPRFLRPICLDRPTADEPIVDLGCYEFRNFEAPTSDLNGDCHVTEGDLGALLAAWGTDDGLADLDRSGLVDGADLGLLLAAWDMGPGDEAFGICCLPTLPFPGGCVTSDAPVGCTVAGGNYLEPGLDCGACFDGAGACCFDYGWSAFCLDAPEWLCNSLQGEFLGAGVPCVDGCADVGACCLPDGTCMTMSERDCYGEFMGAGVPCASGCDNVGACCLGNGVCLELTEAQCIAAPYLGVFQGVGVPCSPGNPCR